MSKKETPNIHKLKTKRGADYEDIAKELTKKGVQVPVDDSHRIENGLEQMWPIWRNWVP